jgi:hypothetical protein
MPSARKQPSARQPQPAAEPSTHELARPAEFETGEITPGRAAEEARVELQSAIIIAHKFRRNKSQAYQELLESCARTGFAERVTYVFPRWDKEKEQNIDITGPSVYLAREAARLYGNMRWGAIIIADDDETRTVEGFAYDLEGNNRVCAQATFKKEGWLGRGKGWGRLNERGIRELSARQAAFLIRNSLLELIPRDFIDDAMEAAGQTLESQAKKDPKAESKKIIIAFSGIGVHVAELEQLLGHPLDSASPAEIRRLRSIYKSIEDGNSVLADHINKPQEDQKPPKATPPSSTNQAPSPSPPPVANGDQQKPPASSAQTQAAAQPPQPAPEPPGEPIIESSLKDMLWAYARQKKWTVGAGSPDDPLHVMLREKGINSMANIPQSRFEEMIRIIQIGPEKYVRKS